MKNKIFKNMIIASILTLTMTLFPSFNVLATTIEEGTFDLNSVDSQSAEIITHLKESEHVRHYEETEDSITFYIEEPAFIETDESYPSEGEMHTTSTYGVPGVTKVVWHSGFLNFDVYLSATAKTNVSKLTMAGIIAYFTILIPAKYEAARVAAQVFGVILPSNTYTYGSVYVFKNGSYRYSYMQ